MKKLETLGFWFTPEAPGRYPRPQALVGTWKLRERTRVAAYLRAGTEFAAWRGLSWCRFDCGVSDQSLGHRDLTDGTFVWPEGLAHYVEEHSVRLPDRFVAHALAAPSPRPVKPGTLVDDGPWLDWSRDQGARLDLDGWEVPGARDCRKIDALLGERRAPIVLARADTRHVVLIRRGGSLEIRHLVPGGDPPRTLPGWDAWPLLSARRGRRPRPGAPPRPAARPRSRPTRRR